MASGAFALESDELDADTLKHKNFHFKSKHVKPHAHLTKHERRGIPNIDSLDNWSDHFKADGYDDFGNPNLRWYTNTVGKPPQHGGTTLINAPIVPMTVDLRNYDGSPRYYNGQRLISHVQPFVRLVLESPVFANANWSSSRKQTQYTDAIQRAQYHSDAEDDWHTLLVPSVKTPRTITLIRGEYYFTLNGDGTCCANIYVDYDTFVSRLFPLTADDTTTPIGAAENAGEMTTKDITTFLFPNTVTYDNGDINNCCTLGFHNYDYEPGDPDNGNVEKRYVMNFANWSSDPDAWSSDSDVYALSHEMAEIFNDPFVGADYADNPIWYNETPWWLSPSRLLCTNIREVGDVLEDLPNANFPITMPNGFAYHLANVALLPWFKREFPSRALHHAYSYPDETLIRNLSDPQRANCQ